MARCPRRTIAVLAAVLSLASCSSDSGSGGDGAGSEGGNDTAAGESPQPGQAAAAATENGVEAGSGSGGTAGDGSEPAATSVCQPVGTHGAFDPAGGPLAFVDVTDSSGLVEPLAGMHGHAAAVSDVNADGWDDLFVGTFADRPDADYALRGAVGASPDRLLLGGPDGFRIDETFPGELGRTTAAAFADLDADGDVDLVLARNSRDRDRGRAATVVLRNDQGAFVEAAVLGSYSARAVVPADLDGDGDLDLTVLADRFGGDTATRWFRNDGALTFVDASADAGLPDDLRGLGAAGADLSGDGWPDLFVAGDAGRNRLLVNDGAGRLVERSIGAFDWPVYGEEDDTAGVAVADLDRNGRLDLVVGHHYTSTLDFDERVPVRVYLNRGVDGDGVPEFEDVTERTGLPSFATKAPDVQIADFDADGWPDLLTTASAGDGAQPAILRHLGLVDGVPQFEVPDGLGDAQYWVSSVVFDADRDGRLDVFVVEWEPALPSLLLRNDGPVGHWLSVVGAPVGSTVEVFEPGRAGDADALVGAQPVVANGGYGAGYRSEVWFGLGPLEGVDVRITSPAGSDNFGGSTVVEAVAADQRISLAAATTTTSNCQ